MVISKALANKIEMEKLHVLITQQYLCDRGDSELFAIEIARELHTLGHQVAVYTSRAGVLAKELTSHGIPVLTKLQDIPWKPDVIHGQQHLQTLAALNFFPSVPVVYCCHGEQPWIEEPPKHPNILKYVSMCKILHMTNLAKFSWMQEDQCISLWNTFQTKLFPRTRSLLSPKGKALFYAHFKLNSIDENSLKLACSEADLELHFMGSPYAPSTDDPHSLFLDYEVVFAAGRNAIEAAASGCGVIPISHRRVGEALTFSNLTRYIDCNFSARSYGYDLAITRENIKMQIDATRSTDHRELSQWIRDNLGMETTLPKWISIYQDAIRASKSILNALQVSKHTALYWENSLSDYLSPVSDLAKTQAELQDLNQRFTELQSELQKLSPENYQSLTLDATPLNGQSQTLRGSQRRQEIQTLELERQIGELKSELTQQVSKWNILEASKTKCESDVLSLKSRIMRLETERQAFRESLEQKRSLLNETKQQLNDLRKEHSAFLSNHKRLIQFLRRNWIGNILIKRFKKRNPNAFK